jgi:hypothetical protein
MAEFESLLAVIQRLVPHALANYENMDASLKEMKTKIKAIREKMASNQEEVKVMREKMEGGQEEIKTYIICLVSGMNVHQAKTEANHEELMAKIKASGKRMEALIYVSLE